MKNSRLLSLDLIQVYDHRRRLITASNAIIALAAIIAITLNIATSWVVTVNLSKTEKYLEGTGSFGAAPDNFVGEEEYYQSGIMTNWYKGYKNNPELLAYMMYRYACLTYATTNQKSWHLYGYGTVQTGSASGKLTASGYRYEKRRGDTMYADSVLQNVNILSDLNGGSGDVLLLKTAKDLVQYGERRAYLSDTEYVLAADNNSFYIEDEYDLAAAKFTGTALCYNNAERTAYKKQKGYVFREYGEDWGDAYGLKSPEKTDFIINTESIMDGSVDIEVVYTAHLQRYYRVSFDVDTLKMLSSGTTASYYFEQFLISHLDLKDGAFSLFDIDVKYNSFRVTMEIWDCGYLRSWNTAENWAVTAAIGAVNIPATTHISTIEYYSYNPADNLFDQSLLALKTDAISVYPDKTKK